MRVLLDECVPRRLKREFVGHDVKTAPEMGWASKKNGELLALAAVDFDVFLTTDRNLSYQQNLSDERQYRDAVSVSGTRTGTASRFDAPRSTR